MNLFCFTLEGSSESIYEPAYSQSLKEVLPKYQCSPVHLRCRPEWGGSDPSINSGRPQSSVKTKRNNRRSCVPMSSSDNGTYDRDVHHTCWMSSSDNKNSSHQVKETCKTSSVNTSTREDRVKKLNPDRTQKHSPAQGRETVSDLAEPTRTPRRIRKLQSLVQTKKGKNPSKNHEPSTDVSTTNNPVLTCIGLGRRAEKEPPDPAPSPQQQHQLQQQDDKRDVCEDSEEEMVWSPHLGNHLWSPFECPQPWSPFYHTCHQPRHELWQCRGNLPLPQMSEWDRFESLIQELDSKQSDLIPRPTTCPATDLPPVQNTCDRFGRLDAFGQHLPLMKSPEDRRCEEQVDDAIMPGDTSSHGDRQHPEVTTEKVPTAIMKEETERREDEGDGEAKDGGSPFIRGHRRSSNSVESLYSTKSGQSSSSGITSGSGCSSNRDSLRLEEDTLYLRRSGDRARVHTDFVPSPYDTESLKLKVGDVIDIIAKPPMGIWKGRLNGRMGNFKFIYVDVLTEDSHEEPHIHRVRQKSTVQEVLRRLSLEEYSSTLQRSGYQTVDDLMRLREHHLTKLNVSDPEHRHRLLAAVRSLQLLHPDSQPENEVRQEAETPGEDTKAETSSRPRDSGCHMVSDSPDSSVEDTELQFVSGFSLTAEANAST